MNGRAGGWFPATQARHQGHIRAGGVDKDVTFTDADPDLNDQIDAAYRDKYRRYGERIIGGVVNPGARAATIKLMPNREARYGASAQSGPELPPGSDRAGNPSSPRRKPAREE